MSYQNGISPDVATIHGQSYYLDTPNNQVILNQAMKENNPADWSCTRRIVCPFGTVFLISTIGLIMCAASNCYSADEDSSFCRSTCSAIAWGIAEGVSGVALLALGCMRCFDSR